VTRAPRDSIRSGFFSDSVAPRGGAGSVDARLSQSADRAGQHPQLATGERHLRQRRRDATRAAALRCRKVRILVCNTRNSRQASACVTPLLMLPCRKVRVERDNTRNSRQASGTSPSRAGTTRTVDAALPRRARHRHRAPRHRAPRPRAPRHRAPRHRAPRHRAPRPGAPGRRGRVSSPRTRPS
jgi:hypothetical protein